MVLIVVFIYLVNMHEELTKLRSRRVPHFLFPISHESWRLTCPVLVCHGKGSLSRLFALPCRRWKRMGRRFVRVADDLSPYRRPTPWLTQHVKEGHLCAQSVNAVAPCCSVEHYLKPVQHILYLTVRYTYKRECPDLCSGAGSSST